MHYFEARYLLARLLRFATLDPKYIEAEIKRYERMNARSKVQLKAEQKRLRDALKE